MLTIIIPSRTDRLLTNLLTSLGESSPAAPYQLLVADNGLSKEMRSSFTAAQYISIRDPFCFARAVNACARVASPTNDLVIMNDDVIIESRYFIERVQAALKAGKRQGYGILSPVTRGGVGNADQAWELSQKEVRTTYGTICFITAIIPRYIWNTVGDLDERFAGMYGMEDVDYSRRVTEAGFRLGVSGAGVIRHGDGVNPFSSTFRDRYGTKKLANMSADAGRVFTRKWGAGHRMGTYATLGFLVANEPGTVIPDYPIIPDIDIQAADRRPEVVSPAQLATRSVVLAEAGPIPKHVLKYGLDTDLEGDIGLLWACVRAAEPRLAVEIGTRFGTSTRAIVDAVRGRGGRVITVDPDPACRRFVTGLVNCKFLQQPGEQFLSSLREEIDFLFIDTDPHTAEQTTMWLGHTERVLSRKGCAVFHDIVQNRPEIQVAAAVREWLKDHPGWSWTEFPVPPADYRWPQGGLGLLRRL